MNPAPAQAYNTPARGPDDPRPGVHPGDVPPVLLPYQVERVAALDKYSVIVDDKSRRIGASWTYASAAVPMAAAKEDAGGNDVLYIGYNLDMARTFIDDCGFWARHLNAFAGAELEEFLFLDKSDKPDDPDRHIQAYRIRFASDFEIVALSSRPRSLRSRQGLVIIDEAAFHDDLPGMIKAAMALLMWGGKVVVVSTHFGADNAFNELVEDARTKRKPYHHIRTTFREAVAQGLYQRICLVRGWEWTQAKEDAWVEEMYGFYGDDAGEELDVIPAMGRGVVLSRAVIEACMKDEYVVLYWRQDDAFKLKPVEVRKAECQEWIDDELAPLLGRFNPQRLSFCGGDFGRTGDLTEYWPGQVVGTVLHVPLTIMLRNMPFDQQEQILWYLLDRLPQLAKVALDARGIGAQIAERTMQRYGGSLDNEDGTVIEVKATQPWYGVAMPPMVNRFQDQTIVAPKDEDYVNDFRALKSDKGIIKVPETARIKSRRGGERHGDGAIACCMLTYAAGKPVPQYGYTPAPRTRVGDVAARPRSFERPDHSGDERSLRGGGFGEGAY